MGEEVQFKNRGGGRAGGGSGQGWVGGCEPRIDDIVQFRLDLNQQPSQVKRALNVLYN